MLREIKVLHLEPTDVCQAACPLCLRETDTQFNRHQQHHLNMQQILQVFDPVQLAQLDKMFMCGNYGDPAAGKHTLDIFQEFRKINPEITLGMNTNGAIQETHWWLKLATILNKPRDYVVFSIDGLEDTNHIYRKNVNWDRLIENASAFIESGGSAHWDMLVYQHNEHQVDACKQLAKDMGFTWFRAKVSKRPLVSGLAAPVNWAAPITGDNIECYALKESSIYLDARGDLFPCCWLGKPQTTITLDDVAITWNTDNPHPVCEKTCSTFKQSTAFTQQWKIEEPLC